MLFEALALTFAVVMPVAKVAELTREHDTRIWRVLKHPVTAARDQEDFSAVTKVGRDETSAREGQDYVSIFADMVARRVLFATEGRERGGVSPRRRWSSPVICRRRTPAGSGLLSWLTCPVWRPPRTCSRSSLT
ncbi:MAG: hypothetical protein ACRDSM_06335, partial [Pseudonocardiaceae bacterium]